MLLLTDVDVDHPSPTRLVGRNHVQVRVTPATAANHDDDEETAKGMARLFAEAAEGFVALVATGGSEVMPMVELMLDVAAFPDDTICAMSFNFWTALSYELTGGGGPQDIDGVLLCFFHCCPACRCCGCGGASLLMRDRRLTFLLLLRAMFLFLHQCLTDV